MKLFKHSNVEGGGGTKKGEGDKVCIEDDAISEVVQGKRAWSRNRKKRTEKRFHSGIVFNGHFTRGQAGNKEKAPLFNGRGMESLIWSIFSGPSEE